MKKIHLERKETKKESIKPLFKKKKSIKTRNFHFFRNKFSATFLRQHTQICSNTHWIRYTLKNKNNKLVQS